MKKLKVYIEKIIANHMNVWKKAYGNYSGACFNFAWQYGLSISLSFYLALAVLGEVTNSKILIHIMTFSEWNGAVLNVLIWL